MIVMRYLTFRGIIALTLRIMAAIAQEAFWRVQRFSTEWHANTFSGSVVRRITRGMWAMDLLNDNQWHQLTDKLKQDGSLADQLPNIRMQLSPNGGDIFSPQSDDPRFAHLVPEPAGAATMLLLCSALLTKRRRKN